MRPLVIATRNAHKVEEIRAVLGGGFRYVTLRDLPGAPEVPEDGLTFAENARLKAAGLAAWLHGRTDPGPEAWLLADDSGLEVDALGGAPGVKSARFAADELGVPGNAPDTANNAKLLRLLAGAPAARRTARFRCALALTGDGVDLVFEGACEGRIGFAPRGAHGFGYDPLFLPDDAGGEKTFAELGEAEKNRISHRARALARLKEWLVARA
jgi:XTP/dITP diphosphohydrolase